MGLFGRRKPRRADADMPNMGVLRERSRRGAIRERASASSRTEAGYPAPGHASETKRYAPCSLLLADGLRKRRDL